MLRILTLTNLYPNKCQPRHGIFVEQRMRRLARYEDIQLSVIAPIPWRPFSSLKNVPKVENRDGVSIYHPRFLAIPKVGMYINPFVMALVIALCFFRNRKKIGGIDLVDAHYFYPDGAAAAMVSWFLKVPVFVTARGTDINLLPSYAVPRWFIQKTIGKAEGVIAVSEALSKKLFRLGARADATHVLKNGVDTQVFIPAERKTNLPEIDGQDRVVLSVGNLIKEKGHQYVLRAVAQLDEYKLIIIGQGAYEDTLRNMSADMGMSERVFFIPNLKQDELAEYYRQAEVLVLASEREGLPNVVLEALASGTPVIASEVGGVPEILRDEKVGRMVAPGAIDEIVYEIKELREKAGNSEYIHQYVKCFSWDNTVCELRELFLSAVEGKKSS